MQIAAEIVFYLILTLCGRDGQTHGPSTGKPLFLPTELTFIDMYLFI